MTTVLLIALIIVSVAALIWLFLKKLPQLRILDPGSLPESQTKQLKYELLRQRVERAGTKHVKRAQESVIRPVGRGLQDLVRRVAGKLTAVERKYQARQKSTSGEKVDKATIEQMLVDGEKLMNDQEWDKAEKKLIEVIGADPKNKDAYETLGRLYLQRKDLELAQETFTFLKKLSPEDASVIASLGEVAERRGQDMEAFEFFKEAAKLSPKNPKYLDFLIDSAINVGDVHTAQTTLDRLSEVNPENKKIELFEQRLMDLVKTRKETK
ncbi:MAG: tetratricopeptide repeat protein [Candidatus Uhrbacteria bacterium]|nr:tetratricopeptide repeat protein [Candidatus Uhrbacteria bacterium]